jgi:hypothetical protein
VIDCFNFFFLFSLMATKIHNSPLFVCCLFGSRKHARPKLLGSRYHTTPKDLGFDNNARPKSLESACLVLDPGMGWQPCLALNS